MDDYEGLLERLKHQEMIRITVYDWNDNLRKIDLTNFLRAEKQIGLKLAKQTVDNFLDGVSFEVFVNHESKLKNILKSLDEFDLKYTVTRPSFSDPNAWFQKAWQLEEDGFRKEALEIRFDLAIRFPKSKNLILTLAKSLEDAGRLDDAERYYRKAIEIAPKWELASLQLFHFLFDNEGGRWEKDRFDEAFDEMRRFQSISHCEDYVEIVREISERYGDGGNKD